MNRFAPALCLPLLAANLALCAEPPTNAPPSLVRPTGPGAFQIGEVHLDSGKREISFPATVNMREGQVEYLVVSAIGKLHESIFKTAAEPFHIHTAVLLLTGENNTNRPPVFVLVESLGQSRPAAELIRNTEKDAPLQLPSWRYQGSSINEGSFLAQRDGSIVAVIEDRDALIDNPGPDRKKDEIWQPIPSALPQIGQPVRITLKFAQEKKE